MSAMKWFYSYFKKYQWRTLFGLILVTATSMLAIVNPKITGYIVDDIIGDGSNIQLDLLPKFLLLMIGATLLRAGIRLFFLFIFETNSQNMLFDMRDAIYRNLVAKDFTFYNNNKTGDLMSRQTGDMMAIRHFVAHVIYFTYECVLLFCISLVMVFTVDWRIACAMLLVLPLTLTNTIVQSKRVKPGFSKIRERFSSLNAFAQENISGNRVVKAFAKEEFEISKFDRENAAYRDSELAATKIWMQHVPIFEFLANLLTFVLMLVGGIMVINGDMTLGNMAMINGYLWMLNEPLRQAGWIVNDWFRFVTSVEKIYATIQEEPGIKNPVSGPFDISAPKPEGSVEFRNVSYSIDGEEILKDISFKIEPGQKVGIIGATGAGKSTLVNLMCRFFDVNSGEVLIGGQNVKEMDLRVLRTTIGMAMQDVFLFSDTIEGNIAYAKPDCPFETVEWAAKVANADGFIREMPEGYDTIIGERGVGLSGGQRQRISLARALLKEPSILVLDDTTSAVDMETESQIQQALDNLEKKETVFFIAHRISSIKDADVILVLDEGRIVESGNHDELMEKQGYYYTVFMHQYGEYEKIRKGESVNG
ncbi:MAG: ABC transporter ATP-binding protein [Lachnospiraceae bacterium]|nr:ABC transporter ATP-binding protein [Lachnospiraceae bacterium]